MTAKVCVLGAGGFIGRNLAEYFGSTAVALTRYDLNLLDQKAVDAYFENKCFEVVFHCAVRGGSRLAPDTADVFYDNLLMFETVAKNASKFSKLVYFSSGARFDRATGDEYAIPLDYYGFSKFVIEQRAESLTNLFILRVYGCFGSGEPATRFLTACLRDGRANIVQDKYFDYIWIGDVCRVAKHYVKAHPVELHKFINLVYREKLKLSQLAHLTGASYEIQNSEEGLPYTGSFNITFCEFEDGVRTGIKLLAEHFAPNI